jgi:hypothetical protein
VSTLALAAVAGSLLAGPATARVPPAAIDQYTEDPPAGPGGGTSAGDGGGGGNPAGGGGGGNPAGGGGEGSSAASGETPPGADRRSTAAGLGWLPEWDSDPGSGAAGSTGVGDGQTGIEASDSGGSTLPLIGYPITWWIWVLMAVALGALLVRGGIAIHATRTRG